MFLVYLDLESTIAIVEQEMSKKLEQVEPFHTLVGTDVHLKMTLP